MKLYSIKQQNSSTIRNLESELHASNVRSLESGFSLIELLAAITVFTVCLGAAYGLLEVARASRSTVNQQVQTMQAARSALNAMGRDVLNVGNGDFRQSGNGALMRNGGLRDLLGAPFQAADFDFMPTITPGNNRNPNNLSGQNTDQITLLYQDISFNNNQSLTSINATETVASPWPRPTPVPYRRNDLIVLSNSTTSAIGMITRVANGNTPFFENNDLLRFNNAIAGGPINQFRDKRAAFTRVVLLTYRVLPDGTLVRTVYGNNPAGTTRESQIQDSPLVQNVENMQIEYVLADGTSSPDPTVVNTPPDFTPTQLHLGDAAARMQNVRQVQVTLTLRSSQKDLRNNQPIKLVLSSTFSTRNMSYDRS